MLHNCKQILVALAVLLVLAFSAAQPLHATEHANHHSDCTLCIQSIPLVFLDAEITLPKQTLQDYSPFYVAASPGYRAQALVFGRLSRAPPVESVSL